VAAHHASNLLSHRSQQSVWDKRGWQGATIEELLTPWFVSAAGVGLLAYSATRRSRGRLAYAFCGTGLLACAAAGIFEPRLAAARLKHLSKDHSLDPVSIESMDSFPASDPPSSTATPTRPRNAGGN